MLVTAVRACNREIPNVHLELPVRRSITALFNLCPPPCPSFSCGPSVWVKQFALLAHWNCSCSAQLVACRTEVRPRECIWLEQGSAASCCFNGTFLRCITKVPESCLGFWIAAWSCKCICGISKRYMGIIIFSRVIMIVRLCCDIWLFYDYRLS